MAAVCAEPQAMANTVTRAEAEQAVATLLRYIGEDVDRDGLVDTPRRVVSSLAEMTEGYRQRPADILGVSFGARHDQLIVVRGVRFASLCEHHLLPFVGTVTVGYVPGDKVVGLSKIARLVHCYARRLQIQERMTNQIADALMEHAGALGAGVIVRAHHACMGCRGVREPDAEMVTSCLLGVLRERPEARAELLELAHG